MKGRRGRKGGGREGGGKKVGEEGEKVWRLFFDQGGNQHQNQHQHQWGGGWLVKSSRGFLRIAEEETSKDTTKRQAAL